MPVRLGVDRVVERAGLIGIGRLGLLTNDAARLGGYPEVRSRVALQRAGIQLARLFSPEHGMAARAADGAAVADAPDPATGLPVVSLYGERLSPAHDQLAGLDAVLVDLPDVGARFYTYAWTMTHLLDACAAIGLPVVVLDRPNPLGGVDAEGPLLADDCLSLSGRLRVPVRHALTIGEVARLWQRERCPSLALDVIACDGWERRMHWPETGLAFVPMSPAMPSYESALCYPGTCLFEATNVGIGRGSGRPFRRLMAPWLDARALADRIAGDARCQSVETAAPSPHVVDLEVRDPYAFRPVYTGLALLSLVRALHPDDFQWADYPTAANPTGIGHFERLIGRRDIRGLIDAGREVPQDAFGLGDWVEHNAPIRLYP